MRFCGYKINILVEKLFLLLANANKYDEKNEIKK